MSLSTAFAVRRSFAATATAAAGPSCARAFTSSAPALKKGAAKSGSKKVKKMVEPPNPDAMGVAEAVRVLRALEVASPWAAFAIQIKTYATKYTNPLRGRLILPSDPRRNPPVTVVFAEQDSASFEAAEEAGATYVGGEDLVNRILEGEIKPASVLATPNMMPVVNKSLARFLGPKGLMPNAKRGTVGEGQELGRLVQAASASVEFKANKIGYIRNPIARSSASAEAVEENIRQFVRAVRDATDAQQLANENPGNVNKTGIASYILHVKLETTNGPCIQINDL